MCLNYNQFCKYKNLRRKYYENIKVGMIGLGSIAQKAYLPILTKSERFKFVGAFTPNKVKREKSVVIIESYHSILLSP